MLLSREVNTEIFASTECALIWIFMIYVTEMCSVHSVSSLVFLFLLLGEIFFLQCSLLVELRVFILDLLDSLAAEVSGCAAEGWEFDSPLCVLDGLDLMTSRAPFSSAIPRWWLLMLCSSLSESIWEVPWPLRKTFKCPHLLVALNPVSWACFISIS